MATLTTVLDDLGTLGVGLTQLGNEPALPFTSLDDGDLITSSEHVQDARAQVQGLINQQKTPAQTAIDQCDIQVTMAASMIGAAIGGTPGMMTSAGILHEVSKAVVMANALVQA
jgi:hypothetical protein